MQALPLMVRHGTRKGRPGNAIRTGVQEKCETEKQTLEAGTAGRSVGGESVYQSEDQTRSRPVLLHARATGWLRL